MRDRDQHDTLKKMLNTDYDASSRASSSSTVTGTRVRERATVMRARGADPSLAAPAGPLVHDGQRHRDRALVGDLPAGAAGRRGAHAQARNRRRALGAQGAADAGVRRGHAVVNPAAGVAAAACGLCFCARPMLCFCCAGTFFFHHRLAAIMARLPASPPREEPGLGLERGLGAPSAPPLRPAWPRGSAGARPSPRWPSSASPPPSVLPAPSTPSCARTPATTQPTQ